MDCEICGGAAHFDFAKRFDSFGLTDVEYWRCEACGFLLSRTHAEMSPPDWARMNALCHAAYQGTDDNPLDPRWKSRLAAQARVIAEMAGGRLIDAADPWLDFGCGDGSLSDLLAAEHGLSLAKYDEYMAGGEGYLDAAALQPGSFDFVITTSVFEHLTRRNQWDRIEALVSPGGAFAVHTLVAERVPSDPDWFYLQPPHCAFFSNAAMARLFQDWGYRCSIYSVEASLWVWFRSDPNEVLERLQPLDPAGLGPFVFKQGFVDYWKSDPRR